MAEEREIKFRIWNGERIVYLKPMHLVAPENSIYGANEYMQFTGLKDKNSKDIYEGDILQWVDEWVDEEKMKDETKNKIGTMEFKNGAFRINTVSRMPVRPEHIAVIGNIYEHPELLNNNS